MAREEKPFVPPTRKPVSEHPAPSPDVVIFSELVNRDDPAYYQNTPVKRGTLYSSVVGAKQDIIAKYPNLYFLRQRRFGQSDQLVFWDWSTIPAAEDTYNAAIEYIEENITCPQFTRVYTIRRDDYEATPTLPVGSILTALIGVTINNGGSGYTFATGTINGTNVAIDFVISNGSIISGIVVNEDTGVVTGDTITISGDGTGAVAIPIIQGTNCFLRSQKKEELRDDDPLRNEFVKVIRIYITLPGPFVTTTRIDPDGDVVTVNTRLNKSSAIISGETLIGGVWTKTTIKDEDDFVSDEVVETRAIPGNVMESDRLDEDSFKVIVQRNMESAATIAAISPREFITTGVWTKVTSEAISDLVAWKIVETRLVPGNILAKTEFDRDGILKVTSRQLVDATTVITSEVLGVNVLTRHFGENVTEIVARQIVEQISVDSTSLLDLPSLTTSIPNLIPEEFRAFLPTSITSHIVEGTAAQPPLAGGEFEHEERQLTPLYKEVRSTFIGGGSLPVTHSNKETTTRFGGGDVNRVLTLELVGTGVLDEGEFVLSSTIKNLGNGTEIKESVILDAGSEPWPAIIGTHVDERYGISVGITKQVVAAGTTGGVVGFDYTDVRPLDKWRSIQIVSSLDITSLPPDTIWIGGQNHSFVPELINASYNFAEGFTGCCDSFSLSLIANINQYSGAVKARYTEQFYLGVPPDDIVVTQFFPTAHSFGFAWASACPPSTCKSGAPTFKIPATLHPLINLTLGALGTVNTLAATTPTALPHGSYIMLPPQVERWRFGVFRRFLTEIFVP